MVVHCCISGTRMLQEMSGRNVCEIVYWLERGYQDGGNRDAGTNETG